MQAKALKGFLTSLLGWDLDLARRNWRELTNEKGKSSSVPFWKVNGRFYTSYDGDGICIYGCVALCAARF
jgi:hypothetical protein